MSTYPYDDTPELARAHELPEVYNPEAASHRRVAQQVQEVPQQEWSPLHAHPSVPLSQAPLPPLPSAPPVPPAPPAPLTSPYSKQDESLYGGNRQTMDSAAASTLHHYAAEPRDSRPGYPASTRGGGGGAHGRGSRLVLVLSILCGVLGMMVVGLAAGTGVVASKYADTSLKLEHISSSYSALELSRETASAAPPSSTASSPAASQTSFSEMTNGCSDNPTKASGQNYASQLQGSPIFTIFCNKDTKATPLFTLFSENINVCIEACASWNQHINENKLNDKRKCKAATFSPLWRNTTAARIDGSPGNCFLKSGDQLSQPGFVEVHTGVLKESEKDDEQPSETPDAQAAKQTKGAGSS